MSLALLHPLFFPFSNSLISTLLQDLPSELTRNMQARRGGFGFHLLSSSARGFDEPGPLRLRRWVLKEKS
jgi:hypothetical protein